MGPAATPRIRRTAQNTQFTYNLSRRVNDVQTYPVQSPQGATILIYGHDNGVTLVWRGGRRFKASNEAPKQPANHREQRNGASEDSVMIIDSDDDEPPAKSQATQGYVDKPEFEDTVERNPYPETIQTLDLAFGTAVLKVAVMPLVPCSSAETASNGEPILAKKMVFAVSCATNDAYLVTLPLTPPSPQSKARPELRADLLAGQAGSGSWGESLTLLSGQTKHSDGLAITLIAPRSIESSSKTPRAVVAAFSRQASGVLHLWDIALEDKMPSNRPVEPFSKRVSPYSPYEHLVQPHKYFTAPCGIVASRCKDIRLCAAIITSGFRCPRTIPGSRLVATLIISTICQSIFLTQADLGCRMDSSWPGSLRFISRWHVGHLGH